jgi:hypothetical protein
VWEMGLVSRFSTLLRSGFYCSCKIQWVTYSDVRVQVIVSFTLLVLIGVPVWWNTTNVYRAQLPHSEIQEWNTKKLQGISLYNFPIQINLHLLQPKVFLSKYYLSSLIRTTPSIKSPNWKKNYRSLLTNLKTVERHKRITLHSFLYHLPLLRIRIVQKMKK